MGPEQTSPLLHHAQLRERLFSQPLLLEPWAAASIVGALADRLGVTEIEVSRFGELHPFRPEFLAGVARETLSGGQDVLRQRREYEVQDGVALIPAQGKLVNRSAQLRPMSGLTGYNAIGDAFDMALADQDVRGVALEIDSPGGEAAGLFDLANRVRAAQGTKPVWAIVHNVAASAAYGLASAADRIVMPEFGSAGSIGVVFLHTDLSAALAQQGIKVTVFQAGERKADGNPLAPLPPEVATRIQDKLMELYGEFVKITASNRKLSQKAVRGTEGEVFYGRQAKELGLVDALAPPNEAMAEFHQFVNRGSGSAGRPAKGAGMTALASGAAGQAAFTTNTFVPLTDSTTTHTAQLYTADAVAQARAEGFDKGRSEGVEHGLAQGRTEAQAAALEQGRRDGAQAERDRVGAILRSEQAEGRAETALSLALDTDLPTEQAVKVLGATPKVVAEPAKVEVVAQATDFASHMAALKQPKVGADLGEPDEQVAALSYLRQIEGRAN
jgi:signal peptide peptidase SppA